jgi:single-strand DNA-binding protein
MVAKLTLVGNLGIDPEVRYTADGKPVVSCRVASNYRKRVVETRDWVDATNWYRVSLFGRLAERMSEQISTGRLVKGARVIVFGRLEATAYMDRNNQPQPSLDVVAEDLIFVEARPRGESGEYGPGEFESASPAVRPAQSQSRAAPHMDEPADLEDLPF